MQETTVTLLTERELAAWRGFLRVHSGLVRQLNTELEASHALPLAKTTEYGLGKHGWVPVRLTKVTKALTDQCMMWIDESFRAVAPKKVLEAYDAAE